MIGLCNIYFRIDKLADDLLRGKWQPNFVVSSERCKTSNNVESKVELYQVITEFAHVLHETKSLKVQSTTKVNGKAPKI